MRDRRQIQPLRQVLTDQAVGILVGRPLPGTVRISEIDVDLQPLGQQLVARHLLALIVGQRLSHTRWDVAELAGEGLEGGFGGAIAQLRHQQVTALALDQGADCTAVARALDQIALPVARDEACRHFDGPQVYRGHVRQLATSILAPGAGHLYEPWPANPEQFKARCAEAKARLGLQMQEISRLAGAVLSEWQTVQKKLPAFRAFPAAVQDIEAQVKRLVHKQFVADTPFERLTHLPRYLKAVQVRLDKLKADPARDARLQAECTPLWTNYERRAFQLAKADIDDPQIEQFRWLLEELRVNLFAQELKTPVPVSVKRLQKQWEGMRGG